MEELLWQFRERCDEHDVSPVFYQVSARYLPVYLDLGLIPSSWGGGHRGSAGFDLAGSRLRNLRQSHAKGKREGLRFEVVAPVRLPPAARVEGDLRQLAAQQAGQGRASPWAVSIPPTSPLNPMALVRREGQIVGFANLWTSDNKESLSIDLMRYSLDTGAAPVMDFLFVELLLWGKGRAMPASTWGWPHVGLQRQPLGGYWARLGNTLFTRGSRFYNFQGLRRYRRSSAQGGSPLPALYRPSGAAPHLDPSRLPHQSRPLRAHEK